MTTALLRNSSPTSCGSWFPHSYHCLPALRTAAGDVPYPIAAASPRSSAWPAPPRLGGCYPPRSWAAAHPRPYGVAWMSGPGLACSTPSTCRCWTGSAGRAGWTGRGRAWTHERARQARGIIWAQIRSIVARSGSKLHLVCDGQGVPLAVALTAAKVNDIVVFEGLVDDLLAVRTPSGRRRCRPDTVHADKGYDAWHCRALLRRRGIGPRLARRGIESSERLGRHRWRVERALSWLSCFRRLQVRWDRDAGRFFAFVLLGCALVCCNRL
jgi:transposase